MKITREDIEALRAKALECKSLEVDNQLLHAKFNLAVSEYERLHLDIKTKYNLPSNVIYGREVDYWFSRTQDGKTEKFDVDID
jgi:hypothetical protein